MSLRRLGLVIPGIVSLRHRGLRLGLAVIGAVTIPAVMSAQVRIEPGRSANRVPDKNAPQIMITSFRSDDPDKGLTGLGGLAAAEMRRQAADVLAWKEAYVIPAERVFPNLDDTFFPHIDPQEPEEVRRLAAMLRAHEFVLGDIAKTGTSFRVTADLVLTRDPAARQPLGTAERANMADAIAVLVTEMQAAHKQIDGEAKCTKAAGVQQWAQAVQFANAAVVAYPKATLARMCLLSVLDKSGAPTVEVVKVARELVSLDPRSNFALTHLARAYRANGEGDSVVAVFTRMLRNDSYALDDRNAAVSEFLATKNPAVARSLIDSAIARNAVELELLKSSWRMLSANRDWKEMRIRGEQIVRRDTAFADTTYFQRTAASFAADSQWLQAATVAGQGVAKFPTNAALAQLEYEFRKRARRPAPALQFGVRRYNRSDRPWDSVVAVRKDLLRAPMLTLAPAALSRTTWVP